MPGLNLLLRTPQICGVFFELGRKAIYIGAAGLRAARYLSLTLS
jgi:hypothetical protein